MSVSTPFQHEGILREALEHFQENHWNVGSQLHSMIQLEKPKGMSRRMALWLMMGLNFIGIALVVYNKLNCDKERVTLMARPDGTLHVLAKWTQVVTDNAEEIAAIAAQPIEDVSWWTIMGVGTAAVLLHGAIFTALL